MKRCVACGRWKCRDCGLCHLCLSLLATKLASKPVTRKGTP